MTRHHRPTNFGSLAATILALSLGGGVVSNVIAQAQAPEAPTTAVALPDNTPAQCLVELSPDGECHVRATPDGRVRYARTANGQILHTFYHCHPRAAAFSPDGQFLVTAGATHGQPGKIKVWRLADGVLVHQMEAEVTDEHPLGFFPEGLVLAANGPNSGLQVCKLADETPKPSVTMSADFLQAAFTDDKGRAVVAISADCTVTIWEVP
jgi:WD40 repeat protein